MRVPVILKGSAKTLRLSDQLSWLWSFASLYKDLRSLDQKLLFPCLSLSQVVITDAWATLERLM